MPDTNQSERNNYSLFKLAITTIASNALLTSITFLLQYESRAISNIKPKKEEEILIIENVLCGIMPWLVATMYLYKKADKSINKVGSSAIIASTSFLTTDIISLGFNQLFNSNELRIISLVKIMIFFIAGMLILGSMKPAEQETESNNMVRPTLINASTPLLPESAIDDQTENQNIFI